jgi:hypothetical protein
MDAQRPDRERRDMNITKVELTLLCTNLIVMGGVLTLMALRGPSVPGILLAIGAAGMAVAKISKALRPKTDDTANG